MTFTIDGERIIGESMTIETNEIGEVTNIFKFIKDDPNPLALADILLKLRNQKLRPDLRKLVNDLLSNSNLLKSEITKLILNNIAVAYGPCALADAGKVLKEVFKGSKV